MALLTQKYGSPCLYRAGVVKTMVILGHFIFSLSRAKTQGEELLTRNASRSFPA